MHVWKTLTRLFNVNSINNYFLYVYYFIIGNLQVAAEENEWAKTGDPLKQEGNYSEAITAYNRVGHYT
jgi:hypothetical protein